MMLSFKQPTSEYLYAENPFDTTLCSCTCARRRQSRWRSGDELRLQRTATSHLVVRSECLGEQYIHTYIYLCSV